jgi:serine/threonine-protein kinase
MRNDLVRVHSGETPEAPKVLTDAERSSLLAAPPSPDRTPPTEEIPTHQPTYVERERGASVGRWLIAVAALAVLTVVVTVAINMISSKPRDVQVPDVRGQASLDATATLQNRGFKTRTNQESDSTVPVDHVISTDPGANSAVSAGDDITINVSSGPEQREVPDVSGLSYAEAVRKLKAAGFEKVKESTSASAPEMKDRVVGTNPPANQTSAVTNVVTIIVGSGPDTKPIPDCANLSADDCTRVLTQAGFATIARVDVDSTKPLGQVVGTNPPAGQVVPLDMLIQIQVSKGNQFTMPNLVGKFWVDAEPILRSLGWTGGLVPGPDVQNSGQKTNAVVTQNPPAGTGVNLGSPITLSFAS